MPDSPGRPPAGGAGPAEPGQPAAPGQAAEPGQPATPGQAAGPGQPAPQDQAPAPDQAAAPVQPVRQAATTDDPAEIIAALFASEGAAEYFGEPVTQAEHMLQAAALAERDGADDALVAAALLHDVGHFTGTVTGRDLMAGTDDRHSETGAAWLARWFGEAVTEPVRLHVDAKRYLCAVAPNYAAALSQASVYTLGVQGGPMQGSELAAFEASPYAAAACRVRRWDDAAKDPQATVPGFDHFRPLLRRLARQSALRARRQQERPA